MKQSEVAITKILDLITVQKKYRPGDKLPNESALAKELGVSRTTVRTAVRYLVGQNVLDIQIGRGTYVMETSQELKFDHLKICLKNSNEIAFSLLHLCM